MTALKGNVNDLSKLASRLNKFPTTLVASVAEKTAPNLTSRARRAFASNASVYGDTRPAGADGQPLDLVKTGATQQTIRFVRIGSLVRCVLGPRYAKYLVGKYKILPMGPMPIDWSRQIKTFVEEEKF